MSFIKKCCNPYPGLRIEPEQLVEFIGPTSIPHQIVTTQPLPQSQMQLHSVVMPNQLASQPHNAAWHPTNPDLQFPIVPMTTTNKSMIIPTPPAAHSQPVMQNTNAMGGSGGTGTIGLLNLLRSSNTNNKPTPPVFSTDHRPKFVDHTIIMKKPTSSLNISMVSPSINTTIIAKPESGRP